MITHEVEVARKTASRVVYMENGHVVSGDSSHSRSADHRVCQLLITLTINLL